MTPVNSVMLSPEYGWTMMIELKVWVSCLHVEKSTMYVKKGVPYNWCEASKKSCDKDAAYIPPVETGLPPVDCDGGHICTTKTEVCKGDNVLTVATESAWEKMAILEVN